MIIRVDISNTSQKSPESLEIVFDFINSCQILSSIIGIIILAFLEFRGSVLTFPDILHHVAHAMDFDMSCGV